VQCSGKGTPGALIHAAVPLVAAATNPKDGRRAYWEIVTDRNGHMATPPLDGSTPQLAFFRADPSENEDTGGGSQASASTLRNRQQHVAQLAHQLPTGVHVAPRSLVWLD
jgi:hypothetical protein